MLEKNQAFLTLLIFSPWCSYGSAQLLPEAIAAQLPNAHEAILVEIGDFNEDGAPDYLVVAGAKSEKQKVSSGDSAQKRWLLAFIQTSPGRFTLSGKNSEIAFAADHEMQCDPLLDSGGVATKGSNFTVENSEACGAHWTDYITFKYDKRRNRFVFHKRIFEGWVLNSSTKPDAPALVRRNRVVTTADQNKPVFLDDYSQSSDATQSRN